MCKSSPCESGMKSEDIKAGIISKIQKEQCIASRCRDVSAFAGSKPQEFQRDQYLGPEMPLYVLFLLILR